MPHAPVPYFPYDLQLSASARRLLDFERLWEPFRVRRYPAVVYFRRLSTVAQQNGPQPDRMPITAAHLNLYATLLSVFRYLIAELAVAAEPPLFDKALARVGLAPDQQLVTTTCQTFESLFPPVHHLDLLSPADRRQLLLQEMLLLRLAAENRAVEPFRWLLDDRELLHSSAYGEVTARLEQSLANGPRLDMLGVTLIEALRAPLLAAPDSLAGQLGYIRDTWGELLPAELFEGVLTAFDILDEEARLRGDGGPGGTQVLKFGAGSDDATTHGGSLPPGHVAGYEQPEYEAFSPDADWMSNVVLIAKMTHVWLDQLSRSYDREIARLDQIPDAELDLLAKRGFTGLWLIGLWERSSASRRIKELCGNPEAHASAYSLYDYTIAADLGGEAAFHDLKTRAWQRGLRLASDMVPNHTGIYSRWVLEHPDWFIQTDYPPFPTYRYHGEDLSHDPAVTIQIEDGYWSKDDAAVTFRLIDRRDGRTRYIYHGNDGTSIPWNDTAQLNYLIPEVREAVMQTILHVARLTPIIRFDAAMTLAKKHYQRLWFPQRGLGGGIPSRAEHAMGREEFDAVFPVEFWREVVDRVAQEAPGTLLLAEAFWMMEGYFVRTLGMHRVYNSAFMNMLKQEENAKYRQTIKNVLEFNPEILKRFVNFMNNPDEKTAVEQFGSQGKYFGACILMSTMPGLPMFGHGQIEGFKEKYGMEYRRAYWDEQVDQGLLQAHEYWVFPLLKRRWLFSGSERFALYDCACHDGSVDEHVFAYSNQVGSERALVLYNNRYGHTSGWIHAAAPVAVKQADGASVLRQSTLGTALALPDGADWYVGFRDLVGGQYYLRSATELHQRGLYLELGEYEFHVFWEFRMLQASPEQPWADLCRQLNGAPVPDLDEALLQMLHRPLIEAFKALLDRLREVAADEDLSSFEARLPNYLAELPSAISDGIVPDRLLARLEPLYHTAHCRVALRRLRSAGVAKSQLALPPLARRSVLAITVLRELVVPLDDDASQRFGLSQTLAAYLAASADYDREWGAYRVACCAATAAAWRIWSELSEQSLAARCAGLVASVPVARFLLIHDDNGVSWFNKERFEELMSYLATMTLFVPEKGAPPVPVRELCLLAAGSGYRVRNLLRLLETTDGAEVEELPCVG